MLSDIELGTSKRNLIKKEGYSMRSAVILAAGKGTRMKSKVPKVLHSVLGQSMILHVIQSLREAGIQKIVVVLGHEAELVKKNLEHEENVEFVFQKEQLGTAHALRQAESVLTDIDGHTLVVCGDTPLLSTETIDAVFKQHEVNHTACTVLTGIVDDATGYGRIIRDTNKKIIGIVEEKDATLNEKAVKEFNSGTYCLRNAQLFENLANITNNNAQGEYYLPDLIKILVEQKELVDGFVISDMDEIIGVNDRVALSAVENILKNKINHAWQISGVTIINPETTYIGRNVIIEPDVIVEPNVQLMGNTIIKKGAIIGMNSQICDSVIGDDTIIKQSVISDSVVGEGTTVGPFAHLRMHCDIGDNVRIGNFVEMKNSFFGEASAAAHLAYVGDSEVGKKVNIGCGTITVNYNGFSKSKTIIEDGAFIGCNTNLIAPVNVGANAIVAAGTTVTKDVPSEALAIGRTNQENKDGYATELNNKNKK